MPAQHSSWMSFKATSMPNYPYSPGLPMYQPPVQQPPASVVSTQSSTTTMPSQEPGFAGFTETCAVP